MTHHLLASEDGGATWQGVAAFIDGASVGFTTEFLRAGNNISFRLITTDGLQTSESRIDNLQIENRHPSVRILSPREGDQARIGHGWSFYGSAYDLDDRANLPGWWTSSLDGIVGTGNAIDGVVLSPGVHDLVFHATDSNRAEGTATVQVRVATSGQFDFALSEESLRLRGPGSNPSHPGIDALVLGELHSIDLSVRNGGMNTALSLWLYLDSPAKSEILLASNEYELEPFEIAILPATFEVT